MEVKELQARIEVRQERRKALEHAEYMYDLLTKAIEEYGDEVKLQYISFTSPVENISFGMTQMPPLPVKTLAKHIGASIKKMKQALRDWDNELKGIVEFDD